MRQFRVTDDLLPIIKTVAGRHRSSDTGALQYILERYANDHEGWDTMKPQSPQSPPQPITSEIKNQAPIVSDSEYALLDLEED